MVAVPSSARKCEERNDPNNRGELLILCSNGETEKAEELLIGGANIDQVDEDGVTALMLSCRDSETFITKILIDAGANLYIEDKEERDASYYARANMETSTLLDDLMLPPPPPRSRLSPPITTVQTHHEVDGTPTSGRRYWYSSVVALPMRG
eukprot:gene1831-2150_t